MLHDIVFQVPVISTNLKSNSAREIISEGYMWTESEHEPECGELSLQASKFRDHCRPHRVVTLVQRIENDEGCGVGASDVAE